MRKAKETNARVAVSDRGYGWLQSHGKQTGGTSPCKVYANRERITDFLLGVRSIEQDAKLPKIGLKLFGGLKDDSGHTQALSCFRVGDHIVNIDGFLGSDLAGHESCTVDQRVRLARTDSVGIDPDGKEAKKGEAGLLIGHVDGVGVREQCEAVVLGKPVQERFWLNGDRVEGAVPNFAELFESKRNAQTLRQVKMPVAWGNAPFLPIEPVGILLDSGPQ